MLYFISYFILVQYYFSLHYKMNVEDKNLMRSYRWFGIYVGNDLNDPFKINRKENDMYFRLMPRLFDWTILFMMSILNSINKMYNNKERIEILIEKC